MPIYHKDDSLDAIRYSYSAAKKLYLSSCPSLTFVFALLHDVMSGAIDIMDAEADAPSPDGGYGLRVRMYRRGSSRHFKKIGLIKNVIFNDPATIVYWNDGTKTVVKCGENEPFDPEKGLAMAITKKMLGNKGNYYDTLKKWLPAKPVDIPVDDCKAFPEDKQEPKGPSSEWDVYVIQKLREFNSKIKDLNEQLRNQNNDGSH